MQGDIGGEEAFLKLELIKGKTLQKCQSTVSNISKRHSHKGGQTSKG